MAKNNRLSMRIDVSYTDNLSDVLAGQMPSELAEKGIMARVTVKAHSCRTGKCYTVSGYPLGDAWLGRPLFRSHGNKEYRLPISEYNEMVETATIVLDKYSTKMPAGFSETIKQVEHIIREYKKL